MDNSILSYQNTSRNTTQTLNQSGCLYGKPSCDQTQVCVNNSCIAKSGCNFNNPVCNQNYDCVNNSCVLKIGCQYDNPICDSNHSCINNTCSLKIGCDYGNPTCSQNQSCVNNSCILDFHRNITVDILVDTDSYQNVNQNTIIELFQNTNDLFFNKTGTGMSLLHTHYFSYEDERVKSGAGTGTGPVNIKLVLGQIYAVENPAEYVLILRKDPVSSLYGGYSTQFQKSGFCNRYSLGQGLSKENSAVAVVDWTHMYDSCGYDYGDPTNPQHVSTVSIGGECRNQQGTQCIFGKFGYYQCNDSFISNSNTPYNQNQYSFASSSIIHELMHSFGDDGVYDHFGTEACNQFMKGTQYANDPLDSERNFEICPVIFNIFEQSFTGCG